MDPFYLPNDKINCINKNTSEKNQNLCICLLPSH